MNIEIERVADDGLSRRVWCFSLTDRAEIILSDFSAEVRETKRHKWRQGGPRFCGRGGADHRYGEWIPRGDVPLPDDVASEATAAVLANLKVIVPDGCFERRAEARKRGY
jgi:hypothetical protein